MLSNIKGKCICCGYDDFDIEVECISIETELVSKLGHNLYKARCKGCNSLNPVRQDSNTGTLYIGEFV